MYKISKLIKISMTERIIDDNVIRFDTLRTIIEDDNIHPDNVYYLNKTRPMLSYLCCTSSTRIENSADRYVMCKYLLDQGASLEIKNKHGDTPLISALYLKHERLASLFISRGANINAMNNIGTTVIQCAARNGYLSIIKELVELNVKVHYGIHNSECLSMKEYIDNYEAIRNIVTIASYDKNKLYEFMIQDNITEFLQTMRIVVDI